MFAANSGAASEEKTYIEDVFSTYLYTGNASTQNINNGIDLAGKGGLVWIKCRNDNGNGYSHVLVDTARGPSNVISSNTTLGQGGGRPTFVTGFTNSGFNLGNDEPNVSTFPYASWTFRKAPKFFDVVTYTGDGTNNREIPHNLGVAPGMVIIKSTSLSNTDWKVWHRSATGTKNLNLNRSDGASNLYTYISTATSSNIILSDVSTTTNQGGASYVAYVFAHDTSTDGLIQCGSFVPNSNGDANIELGWEPQFVLYKQTNVDGEHWRMFDTMRGATADHAVKWLSPNRNTNEESMTNWNGIYSTGFTYRGGTASATYIYMAIRRGPMKTPTDGTKVFSPTIWTGDGTNNRKLGTLDSVDLFINRTRTSTDQAWWCTSRLSGSILSTNSTAEENLLINSNYLKLDVQSGVLATNALYANINSSGYTSVGYFFKRSPGFFDVVCYTGNNATQNVNHNLGVVPELLIIKRRTGPVNTGWIVWSATQNQSSDYAAFLNTTDPYLQNLGSGSQIWGNSGTASMTSTTFSIGSAGVVNSGGNNFVAYLFASCPGVSKVGSYTGNGTSQTINCGFTNGARFFLVKATSTTGNWWVYDTARGVVAAADPTLALNTTAAEVTSADAVDPDSTGIIVNQEATCSINANGVSYIYLAIA